MRLPDHMKYSTKMLEVEIDHYLILKIQLFTVSNMCKSYNMIHIFSDPSKIKVFEEIKVVRKLYPSRFTMR